MATDNPCKYRRERPSGMRTNSVTPDHAIQSAVRRGFVIGREVLIAKVPGVIVGYNIGAFGRFVGAAFPLVVRTALRVTKCAPDDLELI